MGQLVLSIEDNDADFALISMALEGMWDGVELYRIADGMDAIAFLGRAAALEPSFQPSLILLDVNLPRKTGFEILEYIKTKDALSAIPVLLLSSSLHPRERKRAFELGAAQVLTKPMDPDHFIQQLQAECITRLGLSHTA